LRLPRQVLSGGLGERLGRGTGSSLEFMDYREYVPGDDLRHVDWRTYARTDRLHVRLFREEIAPHAELVIDDSQSMAVTEAKRQAVLDLVAACSQWCERLGGRPRRVLLSGAVLEPPQEPTFTTSVANWSTPLWPLRPRSLRLLITDGLSPEDPQPLIRRLAAGGAHFYLLQVLDPWELDPALAGPARLVDCETAGELDLDLSVATIALYKSRLERLRHTLARAVQSVAGSYACVAAAEPERMFRQGLLPQGILEVAE
jgi:uncharacterized protein (DUF58 family)